MVMDPVLQLEPVLRHPAMKLKHEGLCWTKLLKS